MKKSEKIKRLILTILIVATIYLPKIIKFSNTMHIILNVSLIILVTISLIIMIKDYKNMKKADIISSIIWLLVLGIMFLPEFIEFSNTIHVILDIILIILLIIILIMTSKDYENERKKTKKEDI